jgi:hypothetical protein
MRASIRPYVCMIKKRRQSTTILKTDRVVRPVDHHRLGTARGLWSRREEGRLGRADARVDGAGGEGGGGRVEEATACARAGNARQGRRRE